MNYKNILIAVDGSECSKNAAEKGIELANQLLASVIILCVIDMTGAISSTAVNGIIDTEMIQAFKDEAERVVGEIAGKAPSDKITTITLEGIPQYEIRNVARSKRADMIIMGTHGRTGLRHLVMGSVAEYVIRHATIPVLVIPETKKD
ncbi:MAG TPA: universal stress protein [Bacteroidia bacterium]|jgi:nucleotide-binding universal stress UspA family protein|nr:universal stress protein [Bacteroidia bacterium]